MNIAVNLKDIQKSPTFELIKNQPSFLKGAVSVFGIRYKIHQNYNISQTDQEADSKAMYSDWKAVGEDLKNSLNTYGSSKSIKK